VKEQLKAAGIEVTIRNFDPGELFENKLPKRDFTMAEFAQVASPDPSVTTIFGCENVPTKANAFAGQNHWGWCNAEADRLMKESDRTVDPVKRLDLIRQVGDKVREDVVWLPLYQLPSLTAWRTDKIAGPIGTFTSSPPGGFWNIFDWFLK
jgi:peptide/nickel transport system substrate-binding protein